MAHANLDNGHSRARRQLFCVLVSLLLTGCTTMPRRALGIYPTTHPIPICFADDECKKSDLAVVPHFNHKQDDKTNKDWPLFLLENWF